MSNSIFPTQYLRGITFSSYKTPGGARRIQRAVSGRELVVSDYRNPIWNFRLTFSFLRDYPSYVGGIVDSEFRILLNFYTDMILRDDTFLFDDRDDNISVDAPIGTGDGTTTSFQLVRSLHVGGFNEDIIAPNIVSNVKLNGIDTSGYAVDNTTGILTFVTAPPSGAVITATFSFYFRCRFVDDAVEFERAYHKIWTVKELRFRSVVL